MIKGKKRWWRESTVGIERCVAWDQPSPLWNRGFGPVTAEIAANRRRLLGDAHRGKPKTTEHRLKMRQAKLGVPKSAEHCLAKSISAKRYAASVKEIMKELTISWREARRVLASRQNTDK
jgi:hypothetical protein